VRDRRWLTPVGRSFRLLSSGRTVNPHGPQWEELAILHAFYYAQSQSSNRSSAGKLSFFSPFRKQVLAVLEKIRTQRKIILPSKNKIPVLGNDIPVLGVEPNRGWYVF